MSIRSRLTLVSLLPLAILFLLSSYFIIVSYLNFEKSRSMQENLKNNAFYSKALVNIEQEAGLSALFLGSDKKIIRSLFLFKKKLPIQHLAYLMVL